MTRDMNVVRRDFGSILVSQSAPFDEVQTPICRSLMYALDSFAEIFAEGSLQNSGSSQLWIC